MLNTRHTPDLALLRQLSSIVWVTICFALAGCQPEASSSSAESTQVLQVNPHAVDIETIDGIAFLSPQDNAIAAKWLVLRAHKAQSYDIIPTKVEAQFVQRLDQLSTQFKEEKRIITNRIVQTRDLLEKLNIAVSVLSLMDGMIEVKQAHLVGNFGDYCQFYINLRQHHYGHQQALEKMKTLSISHGASQ